MTQILDIFDIEFLKFFQSASIFRFLDAELDNKPKVIQPKQFLFILNFLRSIKEGSNKASSSEIPEDLKIKRDQISAKTKQQTVEDAKKLLKKDTTNRSISRTTKLAPLDRVFLAKFITDPTNQELFDATKEVFPDNHKFKKLLYRTIDTTNNQEIINIEERVFKVVKKEFEGWDDSLETNKLADQKCAKLIRNSFMTYEKNRKKADDTFFKFK